MQNYLYKFYKFKSNFLFFQLSNLENKEEKKWNTYDNNIYKCNIDKFSFSVILLHKSNKIRRKRSEPNVLLERKAASIALTCE